MDLLRNNMHIHLVGIGGIGLSAIARVLRGWGYQVSGSDRQQTALTEALAAEGMEISIGHRAEQISGADLIVVSSAVSEDNPEVVAARRQGVPIVKRKQFLGELTAGKKTIAVAGTHGKTTTTAMIAWILLQAGVDPSFIVGGVLQNLGTNAHAGSGSFFVIEADEYDRTFLGLAPDIAVITTLEHDHPDCYPTFDEMQAAFAEFTDRVVPSGLLVLCGEDGAVRRLETAAESENRRLETYGLSSQWSWWAEGEHLGNHATFDIWHRGARLGTCALQVPGRHNVLNALGAMAAATAAGIDFSVAVSALTRFRGTQRRFEIKGQAAGVTVVDDYAHHPTEIRATLAAARTKYPGRPIWAVFQPHTYSRTAALLDDFAAALDEADHVVVTGIYAAREVDTYGISGADIAGRVTGASTTYAKELHSAVEMLANKVQPGDVVITLGAGDGNLIGEELLSRLQCKEQKQ